MKNGVKHVKLTSLLAMTVAAAMLFPNTTVNAGTVHTKSDTVISAQTDSDNPQEEKAMEYVMNDLYLANTYNSVKAGETCYYTNAAQFSRFIQTGYAFIQKDGPFSITKGVLNPDNWIYKKTVYVVALSGMDTETPNQATGIATNLLAGFEKDNKYLQNVKKAMSENIPQGSNVILAGHSLGGMVAQQVAADKEMKEAYCILNTVTYGSPLINGFDREGTVKRLGDTTDYVPYLSISTVLNVFWQSWGLQKEDGGYNDNTIAHVCSYQREDVWGSYDVTGIKGGTNSLLLDFSTTRYFKSPIKDSE